MIAVAGILISGSARGAGLQGLLIWERASGDDQPLRGPVRLRSIRVCTRRLTSSISTGPFSPSRTVEWVQFSVRECLAAPLRH